MHLDELKYKKDLVLVGGIAFYLHGLKTTYRDVDAVVLSLDGIHGRNIAQYETDSLFSTSGKRAIVVGKFQLDLFIENELPPFEIIEGFQVATRAALLAYYERLEKLPLSNRLSIHVIENLNLLKNGKS